ncbi:hypothetical protein DN820_17020 [Stutzerimonas nosocomialis]|uniref:Uncharacterized protein n=1 Tax=Stutzerimonas nosocomialis TaxID=1056496 RepID=A0A5R9QBT9_9GAMM|nr:hypothetical protein DN820_17020 [Stutzerimonas nosocomialis]
MLAGRAATEQAPAPGSLDAPLAKRWHAPRAHGGELGALSRRWAQFDDPLMLSLIEEGQHVGATLAQAVARIADA